VNAPPVALELESDSSRAGALPLALGLALRDVDPFSLTAFRFAASAAALGALLAARGRLPRLGRLRRTGWALLAVATAGLADWEASRLSAVIAQAQGAAHCRQTGANPSRSTTGWSSPHRMQVTHAIWGS
jgi:hypothetical protein